MPRKHLTASPLLHFCIHQGGVPGIPNWFSFSNGKILVIKAESTMEYEFQPLNLSELTQPVIVPS